MVSADGVCMSDSDDSGNSNWSIAWFESQSSDFSSEIESERSFAVLVPCYDARALPVKKKVNNKCSDPQAQMLNVVLSTNTSQGRQRKWHRGRKQGAKMIYLNSYPYAASKWQEEF